MAVNCDFKKMFSLHTLQAVASLGRESSFLLVKVVLEQPVAVVFGSSNSDFHRQQIDPL